MIWKVRGNVVILWGEKGRFKIWIKIIKYGRCQMQIF